MKMKNIMYVVYSLEIGGLEKCVIDLVNGVDRKSYNPMICCLSTTGPYAEKILDDSVEIFEMNKKSGNDLLLPFRLALLFRRKKVDIVHSGNWVTMVEAFLGAKLAQVPTIIHMEQGMELNDLENLSGFQNCARRVCKRLSSFGIKKIVTVSDDLKNYLHGTTRIKKDKIEVIYNSVDVRSYSKGNTDRKTVRAQLGLSDRNIMIGSVGRLVGVKNYSSLIESMIQVTKADHEVKLFIIGDGPLREELESQIDISGLNQSVALMGERNDIPDLLGAMDIYVLPSIFEGISISILEAMAAKLPVVATRVGGNPEIIVKGKTGFLVESRNSGELALRLIELAKDQGKRSDFSKAAFRRVKEVFNNEIMVSEYSELYSGILK